jgi:hypothetical protein
VSRIASSVAACVLALVVLATAAVGSVAADPGGTTQAAGADAGPWSSGDGGSGSPLSLLDDPLTLLTILFVGIAAAVAVERRSSDDGGEADGGDPDLDPLERAGRAAGRAARRLSGSDPDGDALERDWHELASALGIDDPARCPPETVEERALSAGVDRDLALRLVDTYDVVRSGGANDRREREAATALRAFAAAHADDRGA